ncbi:SDR family NAD(P)-dependent oxidoreductase [Chitinophaga sp.]|uniref:SDR family NAD(P)-dependent oxidoreductase n=1 Tax=Chitinophaga sp. TaxID=1869181 RepID=UPI0031E1B3F9
MLKGRTILITGGGSGIGETLTNKLSNDNKVIICGRNEDKLKKVAAANKNVSYYVADVSVPDEIDELFQRIKTDGMVLDVLFNNAGVVEQWDITKSALSSARIFEKINTNLSGAIAVTQQFVSQANKLANNLIVNVTSSIAIFPFPVLGLYSTSKSGLSVFTKMIRQQLKGTNFKVVEILPSQVDTEMPKQLGFTSKGANVQDFAGKVINAINKGKTEFSPDPNASMLKLFNRLLPESSVLNMADKISRKILKGR